MVKSETKMTYHKHHVKRNPSNLKFLSVDDKGELPVLGDFIREARITENIAEELNLNWQNSGFYWQLVKNEKTEKEVRSELFAKAQEMVDSKDLEKMPAKNIKTEELIKLIKGEE